MDAPNPAWCAREHRLLLEVKFEKFGIYEDAILQKNTFMFHGAISPSLNMGLITPNDIIDKVLAYTEQNHVPLNSVGFYGKLLAGESL